MQKSFIYLVLILVFFSCNTFEEDHNVKKVLREHLNSTLHDPESFEEVKWNIIPNYVYKDVDSTDPNSPLAIDHMATAEFNEKNGKTKFVELIYRAKNGFGALRKGSLYAIYFEDGQVVQFEDGAFSIKLNTYLPEPETAYRMNPEEIFLQEQYYMRNNGSGTYEGFLEEYPEFDLK